ncbi:MAG: 2Fe-2S iron-sulfur cluster-binding protein [bacterium]
MGEPEEIAVTIDGRPLKAFADETLLRVAQRNGVAIPTLCDHKAVLPYGACRLCVVDVQRGGRTRLVVSCVYQPAEGDVVETNSPRVRQTRRMVLELLVARCPRVAQVRRLAAEYGAEQPRFHLPEGAAAFERCILCGLCVRVCKEVIGQSAIGYVNRGARRAVTSPLGVESSRCTGCGACVHVCPTGALHMQDDGHLRIMQELHTKLPMIACLQCGKHFATEKQVGCLSGRTAVPRETLETCPACRRRETVRRTVESGIKNKQAMRGIASCPRS